MKKTPYAAVLCGCLLVSTALAQISVTAITTATTDALNTTHDGVVFENTRLSLSSFTAGGTRYAVSSLANAAYVRRSSSNANQSSVWYRDGTTSGSQLGTFSASYPGLMLDNNLSGGSDNTFANGSTAQDGNIERLDFVFTGGMTASNSTVFAVFERGAPTIHDQFKIAVITGWDAVNNVPTSYGLLTGPANSAAWGSSNVVGDFNYHLFRYNQGDNLTTSTARNEVGAQGIGGIAFTMSQLGIAPGTTIYGYSLFGNDVTNGGNSANLLNVNNALYYPTNTSNATGTGGIDLATINGIAFTVIPSAAEYGLMTGGVMVAVAFMHRHRRRRR